MSALDFTARALATRAIELSSDSSGYITPEQLGCPAYAPGVDQLPWLQQAIDHVEATPGLNGVLLTQRQYELWRTEWTGSPSDYGTTFSNSSGNFLVVRKPIRIVSTHPLGTTLQFKGPNGGPLLTDYDVIDGTPYGDDRIHRGIGFLLWSESVVIAPQQPLENLPALYLENIQLVTGMVAERDTTWPASVSNPNCWDITNKCIAARNDHQHGRVEFSNCVIDGFFGEVLYLGGAIDDDHDSSELVIRQSVIRNSNGQAMNPNGCAVVDVDGLLVENCSATWEGYAGLRYARLANCMFRNCSSAAASAGSGSTNGRRDDGSQPVLTLHNVTAQNCARFFVGSHVKGTLHLIDTALWCFGATASDVLKNIDLDVTIECDTANIDGGIMLLADAAAPAQSVENVQIRALLTRSDRARANNLHHNGPIVLGASYGPNCVIRVRGDHGGDMPNYLGSAPTFTDYRVKLIDEGLDGTGSSGFPVAGRAFDAMANPNPEFGYGWLRATFGTSGTTGLFPVNAPPLTNFLDGHEVTISNFDGSSPNARIIVAGRVVLGFNDVVKLRANKLRDRWDVVEGDNVVLGPIAIGDETSAITAGAGKTTFIVPQAFVLRDVIATVRTAQASGSVVTVDLNESGASVLSTKLTIDNGEVSSRTAATPLAISDASLAANAVLTVDVDQIGDGSATGLCVWLVGRWT